jgi:hypothetical protein
MSVQTCLEDARLLIEHGRDEGALLSVLVAVAATARRRFPQGTKGDRGAFEAFVTQEIPNISSMNSISLMFQGQNRPLGEVLYKWLRCNLAHEGELPPEIGFVPDPVPGKLLVHNQAGPPERIVFSHTLVILLADMVARAKENGDLPRGLRESIMGLMGRG